MNLGRALRIIESWKLSLTLEQVVKLFLEFLTLVKNVELNLLLQILFIKKLFISKMKPLASSTDGIHYAVSIFKYSRCDDPIPS